MPPKKKTAKTAAQPSAADTLPKAKPTAKLDGIPLGRSAFPANVLPNTGDALAPAGALAIQVPNHDQKTPKAGTSTLTIQNPNPITPTAAAKTVTSVKRG